ncbi:hypothetical protein D0867_11383 [Hortaea werneckii]|uniref:Bromodomain-containing protein n=2 Tax=Hortaea werneckii TaxID=91943 RepID=A0A3M6YF56_HORWE|nr:hypothetical protein D0867_11383 [Hortaea werneckii]
MATDLSAPPSAMDQAEDVPQSNHLPNGEHEKSQPVVQDADVTNKESFQENGTLPSKDATVNVKDATAAAPDPNPAGPTPTDDVAGGIQPVSEFVPKDAPASHPTPPPDQPLVTSEADVDTKMEDAVDQPADDKSAEDRPADDQPAKHQPAEDHPAPPLQPKTESPLAEASESASKPEPQPDPVQAPEQGVVRQREDDEEDEERAAKRSKVDGSAEVKSEQPPATEPNASAAQDDQEVSAPTEPASTADPAPKSEAPKAEENAVSSSDAPPAEAQDSKTPAGDAPSVQAEGTQQPAEAEVKPSTEGEAAANAAAASKSKYSTAPLTLAQKSSLLEKMKNLKKTKSSIYFTKPVDYVALNIPSYPTIIKQPMDLGTMERKLKDGQYATVQDFVNDFELVVNNCRTFNGDQHPITTAAMSMEAYFRRMMETVPSPDVPMAPKTAKRASPAVKPAQRREHRAAAAPTAPAAKSEPYALVDGQPQIRRESTANDRPARAIKPPQNREIAYAKPRRKEAQLELRFCEHVLDEVRSGKYGNVNHVFLAPVDPVALNIPNYRQIIKHPMDLGTMSQKLKGGQYSNAKEFKKDFDLMIDNCLTFNPVGNPVRDLGVQMRRIFEQHWNGKEKWERAHKPDSQRGTSASDDDSDEQEEEEDDAGDDDKEQTIQALQKQLADMQNMIAGMAGGGNVKAPKTKKSKVKNGGGGGSSKQKVGTTSSAPKAKIPAPKPAPKKAAKPKQVTYDEKQEISEAVGRMNDSQVGELTNIITENCAKYRNMDEMELEIDELPNDVQALLLKYVRKLFGKPKGVAAADSPPDDGAFEDDGEFAPARASNASKRKKHKPMGKREQAEAISQLKNKLSQFGQAGNSGSESPTNSGFNAAKADSSGDDESEESEEE